MKANHIVAALRGAGRIIGNDRAAKLAPLPGSAAPQFDPNDYHSVSTPRITAAQNRKDAPHSAQMNILTIFGSSMNGPLNDPFPGIRNDQRHQLNSGFTVHSQ